MPKGEWRRLENEAAELGITVSELVRLRLADNTKGAAQTTPATPSL